MILRLAQLSLARGNRAGAVAHVAELRTRDLPGVRPDLTAEFDALQSSLSLEKTDREVPEPT